MRRSATAGNGREVKSFCRICTGMCATIVTLDESGRIAAVRGDKDDPQTLGYICSKGANAPDFHNIGSRILRPLKRRSDGTFAEIPLSTALEEIGDRLAEICDRDGPDAVASFRGSGGFFSAIMLRLVPEWLTAIGTAKNYSTLTIDQSAKAVTVARIGMWAAGKHRIQESDVALVIGSNPLVSITQLDPRHPLRRLNELKARGMKLIVIDPRRTETAEHADLFVQPLPGFDAAIMAAVVRTVLRESWHDAAFCAQHVGDLSELRAAVEPFAPQRVAALAGLPADAIQAIAAMFARDGTRGLAATGTGPDMGPHSNLAEHLVECLNTICGRFVREGEEITNNGFLFPGGSVPAQVVPLRRTWESGPKNRINGYGRVFGEMATSAMADDILQPGPGQVRCLFNIGGNPANCVPDQRKMVSALRTLELLVSLEPYMTQTAQLSHYVLPPKLFYERADLPFHMFEKTAFPTPYTRYTPALAEPPPGSDLCDEWLVLWHLARRLGKTIRFHGVALDMERPPTEDELLGYVAAKAVVPWEEIKRHPEGCFHESRTYALPADPATAGKFTTMPDDVRSEIAALDLDLGRQSSSARLRDFPLLLACRRQRHRFNSMGFNIPQLQKMTPRNLASMNPDDMAASGVTDGDWIEVISDHGSIRLLVEQDTTLRRGVVSISHGFGGLPDESDYLSEGASPNLLISTDRDLQTINGMPRMTAVPVKVCRAEGPRARG